MDNNARLVELAGHGDHRGGMVVAECGPHIPFDVKRIFYSYGFNSDSVRGRHANRYSKFFMICVAGSCKIRIRYACGEEKEFLLDSPDIGLYIPNLLWKEMYDFSSDAVLMVLSDKHYDAEEYIRDFELYKQIGSVKE